LTGLEVSEFPLTSPCVIKLGRLIVANQTDSIICSSPTNVSRETSIDPSSWLRGAQDRSTRRNHSIDSHLKKTINDPGLERASAMSNFSLADTQLLQCGIKHHNTLADGTQALQNGRGLSSPSRKFEKEPMHPPAVVAFPAPRVERMMYSVDHYNLLRDSIYSLQSEGMLNEPNIYLPAPLDILPRFKLQFQAEGFERYGLQTLAIKRQSSTKIS
jgi:hypothetical protein